MRNAEVTDIFIHIPKTAGTTLAAYMDLNYGDPLPTEIKIRHRNTADGRGVTAASDMPEVEEAIRMLTAQTPPPAAVIAMLPYGLHRVLNRPCRYFSLIRDPVERAISAWFFACSRRETNPLGHLISAYRFDFARLLEDRAAFIFHNDQVRMLSGTDRFEIGPKDFECAIELIELNYVMVGLTERFNESVQLIGQILGWTKMGVTERYNQTPNRRPQDIPECVIDALRRENSWDIALHEWILKVYFPRRMQELNTGFRHDKAHIAMLDAASASL
jgi:Sulfotransferase family